MYIGILQVIERSQYTILFFFLLVSRALAKHFQVKCLSKDICFFFVVNKFIPWAHQCRAPRYPAAASPAARGDRRRPPRRTPRTSWAGRRCWAPTPAGSHLHWCALPGPPPRRSPKDAHSPSGP